ncbi:MAG: hypothetical protein GEV11_16755 [Streptosporangiales bacterium]|nr:hypothetical protein [Streptosporangiales bacterium]
MALLTQARPITTLYPIPEPAPGAEPGSLRVYFSVNVAQGVFRPFTPLGIAAFKLIGTGGAQGVFGVPIRDPREGAPILREAGGRLFFDATGALRTRAGRTLAPHILDVMEARSAVVLRDLMTRPELTELRPSWRPFLRGLARVALRNHIPPVVIRTVLSPAWGHRRAAEVHRELEASWRMPDTDDTRARLDHVQTVLTGVFPKILPRVAPVAAAGFVMLGLAYKLLGDRARPGELSTVLRGLPHNVTTEMDLDLWHLAGRIRADEPSASLLLSTPAPELAAHYTASGQAASPEPTTGEATIRRTDGRETGAEPATTARTALPPVADDRTALPPVLADGLTAFLARYGDRAVAEIDLGLPRWSEDPSHILGMLANYLRLEDPALAPDTLFERGAREAEAAVDTLAARAGGVRGRMVRFALGRARELAGLRELPKFMIVRTLAAMRRELARAGAAMAARGELEAPEDVFFLTFTEVYEGGDRRAAVAERRATYERELRRRHVPRVLLSDGTEPEATGTPADAADGALTGTPASADTVTGVARVVLDPTGAHLEPGEILVAPSTDPGWTPLFLTAGGLVMEMGGANSHGAVVAREYGIPAVVGVHAATERIRTGQTITVDGATGTVRIHDEPE